MYAKDTSQYSVEQSVTCYNQDLTCSVLERPAFFVVANGAVENQNLLNNLLPGVKSEGFLLSVEQDLKLKPNGADIVAKYSDGHNYYVLLKKVI